MSIRIISEVWKTQLPISEKMVLLVIADHASDDGSNAWPSQATIAAKSSLSLRTVQRCINNLVKAGYLRVEKHAGGDAKCREDRRPNLYTIYVQNLRGGKLTGRSLEPDGAAETADTGRRSRPLNRPNKPSINLFETFWEIYPKKVGKLAAQKAFRKAVEDGFEPEDIVAGAKRYAADKNRVDAYTTHPATWINAGRWLDETPPTLTQIGIDNMMARHLEYEAWKAEIAEREAKAVPMPESLKNLFKKP